MTLMDFPRTPPAGLHTPVESHYHSISICCFIAEKVMAYLLEEPTVLTITTEIELKRREIQIPTPTAQCSSIFLRHTK